jgi:hypothetical protein
MSLKKEGSFPEEMEDNFMKKEENLIGMSDAPEKEKKKSHLLAISLVLGMALFNVAAEQVRVTV